jgi:ribosome modulation factor
VKGLLSAAVTLAALLGLMTGAVIWSTHTHDRREEEARREGYEAGKAGIPVGACPEYGQERIRAWKRGWIDGRKELP